jgi:hypothetical protein
MLLATRYYRAIVAGITFPLHCCLTVIGVVSLDRILSPIRPYCDIPVIEVMLLPTGLLRLLNMIFPRVYWAININKNGKSI